MAKTRAQRKAEAARKRKLAEAGIVEERDEESHAQHDTQVPESADVVEAELAIEHGADGDSRGGARAAPRPANARPPRGAGRAAQGGRARAPRSRPQRRSRQGAGRRAPARPGHELLRLLSAELRKVQWPDRDTLVQASAVTLLFVAVAAAYLGVLDAIFSCLIDLLI